MTLLTTTTSSLTSPQQYQQPKLFSLFSSHFTSPRASFVTANDIAPYFTKKVKAISPSFTPMPIQKAPSPTLSSDGLTCFSPLSSEDVLTLVTSNRATTCSLDPMPFLTTLINSSLTSGLNPAPFKTATVKPLLKKPTLDSADIWNYRPVSPLSFLCKTLEHAVCIQLSSCLLENDLLDSNQSGFRTAHSIETALLIVTESRGAARASSRLSVLILLDLSSAFHTVNHRILLSTLA